MLRVVFLWMMVSFSVPGPVPGMAQESRQDPVFGIFDTFPYHWIGEGREEGLYTDLVRLISREAGQDFLLRAHPFARVLYSLKSGNTDFSMIAVMDNEARGVTTVAPLICASMILVPRQDAGIRTLEDIKGKRIAYTGNSVFEKSGYTQQDIIPVPLSQPQLYFAMLATNRLDAFVMNNVMYHAYLEGLPIDFDLPDNFLASIGEPIPVVRYQLGLVMSKKSAHAPLAADLRQAVARLHGTGAIQDIFRRYGSNLAVTCSGEDGAWDAK